MAASATTVSYRPIRLGWCVRKNNWDDLRRAIRLSHTLWGGRFNPLIPVGDSEVAEALVRLYRVDALYAVAADDQLKEFIANFSWLPWPNFGGELFIPAAAGKLAAFLDIYHVVRDLFDQHVRDKDVPQYPTRQIDWDTADPLSDVFLAYFGGYPSKEDIFKDYSDLVERNLHSSRTDIGIHGPLSPDLLKVATPSALTAHLLEWESLPKLTNSGIYFGDARDFEDIVNFWNLRAADAELIFWDENHSDRLARFRDAFLEMLAVRVAGPALAKQVVVWARAGVDVDLSQFASKNIVRFMVSNGTWDGYHLKPAHFRIGRSKQTLAAIDDEGQGAKMALSLPEKPFFDDPELFAQKVVVSVSSVGFWSEPDEWTFRIPFLPVLNAFYGKRMQFDARAIRAEEHGPGIITRVTTDHVTLNSVSKRELVCEMFRALGMRADLSAPGRIASRIMLQMGGVQGCRVFKIPGVRDLLRNVGPRAYFERTYAVQTIGRSDPCSGLPNFSEYEGLFIEYRESGLLKPDHVFLFLLKKGILQVGLCFTCPHCELEPWISLDDLSTESKCPYCGKPFLTAPQLRDRNWKYRWSGLFGREDNQEGSIPVVLTLQQIDTVLSHQALFIANAAIYPTTAPIEPCESDFVLLHQQLYDDRVSVAIGECKTAGEISEDDARKLGKVADVLEGNGLEAFIVFSKLAPFASEEIERCRSAQSSYRQRVIMLSDRELEPYFVYERTKEEFQIQSSVISLQGLAAATDLIYFHPRPREKP